MNSARETIRLDKWLWHARFFKSRSRCAKVIAAGHLRINGNHIRKTAYPIGQGDVLTFPQGEDVRVIEVQATGKRRGPAVEAAKLYTDLSPPVPRDKRALVPSNPKFDGKGRPGKKERRAIGRFIS